MFPYADVDDFKLAYDTRALAELGSDTGLDGVVSDANTILVNALTRASTMVQSQVIKAGQYTVAQLATIAETNWALKGIVCDLAAGFLVTRRMGEFPDSLKDRLAKANAAIEDLAAGVLVFGEVEGAKSAAWVPSVSPVSVIQRNQLGLATSEPFFPQRSDRVV